MLSTEPRLPPESRLPAFQVVGRAVGCRCHSVVAASEALCVSFLRADCFTSSCDWADVLNSLWMQEPCALRHPEGRLTHGAQSDISAGTLWNTSWQQEPWSLLYLTPGSQCLVCHVHYRWCISSCWFGAGMTNLSRPFWILSLSSILILCFWKFHYCGSFIVM